LIHEILARGGTALEGRSFLSILIVTYERPTTIRLQYLDAIAFFLEIGPFVVSIVVFDAMAVLSNVISGDKPLVPAGLEKQEARTSNKRFDRS
jgi:hypothetical protein